MPTRKPTGALPGRPPLIGGKRLKNCVITMPQEMSEFAEALGNGNRSEGVRLALLRAQEAVADDPLSILKDISVIRS